MDLWITTTEQAAADPTLATFLLDRLARLADRLAVTTDERERRMLARGLFAIFLDCLDLDLGGPARAILADHRAPTAFGGNGAAA